MGTSTEKINNLISEELAEIINREVEFESGMLVSIGLTEVANNLSWANVFIQCFPEDKSKEAIKILYRSKTLLREELGKKIKLRKIPHLRFYVYKEGNDEITAREEIDRILEKIKEEDAQK